MTVYRLITQHSIEERILQRAKEKSEVGIAIFCIKINKTNNKMLKLCKYVVIRFKEW